MAKSKPSQATLIFRYYKANPGRDIPHPEIVDWATEAYKNETGQILRDPDRTIRSLHQKGYLIKVNTGIYRYDPDLVSVRNLEDFSESQKLEILKRDGYKCVVVTTQAGF